MHSVSLGDLPIMFFLLESNDTVHAWHVEPLSVYTCRTVVLLVVCWVSLEFVTAGAVSPQRLAQQERKRMLLHAGTAF